MWLLRNLWGALNGRPLDDLDGFKKTVCDNIIGSLKGDGDISSYDRLDLWVSDNQYKQPLRAAAGQLVAKDLRNLGGEYNRLSDRLCMDALRVFAGTPLEGSFAKRIISANLPADCKIWYSLYKADVEDAYLILKSAGCQYKLDPSVYYIIGREDKDHQSPGKISIPDPSNRLSREQAAIYCTPEKKWYCKPLRANCATEIPRGYATRAYVDEPVQLNKTYPGNYAGKNTITFCSDTPITLEYSFEPIKQVTDGRTLQIRGEKD